MNNKQDYEVMIQKLQEERDALKRELQNHRRPLLFGGTVRTMLESGKAIVKSSTGPLFAVVVNESIPRELLVLGAQVLLHQRNFAVFEVLPTNDYPDLEGLHDQLIDIKASVETLLDRLDMKETELKED